MSAALLDTTQGMGSEMIQHPLSAAFPAMTSIELADLTNDIRANGQRQAITLFDGMVLDGWHRYTACRNIGIEPSTVELQPGVDPMVFVQSMNLNRRHLNGSQRAAIITACGDWARSGDNQHTRGGAVTSPPTVEEMAEAADVSVRTIQQAKAAHTAGLGDAMREGKVTAERAAEIAKLPEEDRQAAIAAPPVKAPKRPKAPAPPMAPVASLPEEVMALHLAIKEREDEIAELAKALDESLNRVATLEAEAMAHATELREMTRKFRLADDRARVAKGGQKRKQLGKRGTTKKA